jgi:ubiquinol-cytochrome c reductase iron-sulfur subunit
VRADDRAAACFVVAAAAAVALAGVYVGGGQAQAEGILLAVALGGIGTGIIAWARGAEPDEEVAEARGRLSSTDEAVDALTTDLEESAPDLPATPTRRRLLLGSAAAAFGALGAALVFPIRSLGPRPGRDLKHTPYADQPRIRVVREDGAPVRPQDLAVDSVVTVFPEGHRDAADAPTLLIRTRPDRDLRTRDGREGWTVDGIVAYSKLCTHVGCPVGLYQSDEGLLLCPCHQSTFDVYDGARPVFGPAARSLPQLPLDVDDDGFLVATGEFSDPVGPGFWDRGRDE